MAGITFPRLNRGAALLLACSVAWTHGIKISPAQTSVRDALHPSLAKLLVMGAERHPDDPTKGAFDFGVADQLDTRQGSQDAMDESNFLHVLPGVKHLFTLRNAGNANVTIMDLQANNGVAAEIIDSKGTGNLPYIVRPNQQARILVALNYDYLPAGPALGLIKVLGEDTKTPLAQLLVHAIVKSGVEFEEKKIDFGAVSRPSQCRIVTLFFDRRVPTQMLPLPLQCVSRNPYLTSTFIIPATVPKGIKFDKDGLTFTNFGQPLPQDFRVRVRVGLRKDIPLGSIDGRVELIMKGAPLAAIVEGAKIPVQGTVRNRRR